VSGNGGMVLANTAKDEWLEYTVDIKQAGKYNYEATVSSAVTGASFKIVLIESDGTEKTLGNVSVPKTGSNDTYQVKKAVIRNPLQEGKQKIRITVSNGGCNIDKVEFICTEPTGIQEIWSQEFRSSGDQEFSSPGETYNLAGQKVSAGYKGIVVRGERLEVRGEK